MRHPSTTGAAQPANPQGEFQNSPQRPHAIGAALGAQDQPVDSGRARAFAAGGAFIRRLPSPWPS